MAEQLVKIKGLTQLKRNLRSLPTVMKNQVLTFATAAGARAVARDARRNVPVGRGVVMLKTGKNNIGKQKITHLKNAIRVRKVKMPGTGKISYAVYISGKGGPRRYAHLVEFGTKPHIVKAKKIGAYYSRKKHAVMVLPGGMFIKRYRHPGAKPHPFMRPALERGHVTVVAAMIKEANKRIDKLGGKWRTR